MARAVYERTELTTPADGDWLDITDVSDASQSAGGTSKKISRSNLLGSPGLGGHVIQDEAVALTARAALNFTGAGVTATDNAASGRTDVTIPGAAVSSSIQTSATALNTTNTIGAPRWSTANSPVTFTLDDAAPLGASGTIIQGSQDITVVCATADVLYGQPGDDFTGALSNTAFQCQGVMAWEVVEAVGSTRKYLIIGQTSLSFTDKINLATDVEGILPQANGGTNSTAVANNATVVAIKATADGALSRTAGGAVSGDTTFSGRLKTQEQVVGYVSRALVSGGTTIAQSDNGKVFIYGLTVTLTVPKTNTLVQVADEVFMAPIFNVSAGNNVTVTGGLGTVVIGPKGCGMLMGLHGAITVLVHQGVMTNIESAT